MKKISFAFFPLYVRILFVVCLVSLAGIAVSNYRSLQGLKQNSDQIERSWSVRDHLKNINLIMMDGEANLRRYYISDDPTFLRQWPIIRSSLKNEFSILWSLVANDPAQEKNLEQLQNLVENRMRQFEDHIAQFNSGALNPSEKIARARQGGAFMDEIRLVDVIMEKEELAQLTKKRNRFYDEYFRSRLIDNMIIALAMITFIIFYRMISMNFKKQGIAEDALKRANDNLESTVATRTAQLSVLSRYLIKISEEEKSMLARELHDEMGASLTALNMDISLVMDKLKKTEPALAAQLQRAKQTLLETVDLKRRIVEDLRPSMLDNLGLAASIRNHCEKLARVPELFYEIDIDENFDDIDPAWAIALFRVVQESLNNVIKYAKASKVTISLKREADGLRLRIIDDGVGIAKDVLDKPMSHGLVGMRERVLLLGGSFTVSAGVAGCGTVVGVYLPFNGRKGNHA